MCNTKFKIQVLEEVKKAKAVNRENGKPGACVPPGGTLEVAPQAWLAPWSAAQASGAGKCPTPRAEPPVRPEVNNDEPQLSPGWVGINNIKIGKFVLNRLLIAVDLTIFELINFSLTP